MLLAGELTELAPQAFLCSAWGMGLPTEGGALLHQLTTKTPPHMTTGQSDLGISSNGAFLSDESKLCQVDGAN